MAAPLLPDPGSPDSPSSDFGFAFNDVNFSDRIMRIEILPDLPGSKPDPDDSLSDWAPNRKRRRDDPLSNASDLAEQIEEQILNNNMPDLEDGVTYENQEDAVVMIGESPVGAEMTVNQPCETNTGFLEGHEVVKDDEPSSSMEYSGVQVRTVHISSPILAAKSPFFYKLFSNGMRESEQRHVTLQIQASEEDALLDLLNFIYSNTLPRTTPTALLDVLMAADKFEVASCMRYCSRLLRTLPMTCESALLYLDLPSTVLMADTVQQLTDAAKQFLAGRFKDLSRYQEEVLNLPLAGIEAVLSSDDLQVASEDAIYDFVVKWARVHYPKLEERRDILSKRLLRFVRFPCMTCRKLKKVLTCGDIDTELASKVVLDALFFKAEAPYRQRSLLAEDANASFRRFVERSYKYRPVKVVEFESPWHQCIVYLDLKREECAQMFPSGRIYSQAFHLGGQGFFLSGHCNMDQASSFHCFGLFLGMQEKGSVAFTVDYEFAARMKPLEDFVSKYKGKYMFMGGKAVGYRNLFMTPWTAFMADDSPYFINGVLHLRAELTIRRQTNKHIRTAGYFMEHKNKSNLCFILLLPFLHFTSLVHCLKNSFAESLDTILHDHALRVMTQQRRHTDELYDASLPEYLAGIKVSVVGLRSRTLWRKGANFSSFLIPPKTLPVPYVKRLLIVYHNLGNWSSSYYSLSGYTLLSPVVGFLIYDASYLSSNNFSRVELNTNGKTISIAFNNSSSARGNQMMKCAAFGALGDIFLSELSSPNTCYSRSQGHFSIVIPFKKRHKMSLLWIVGLVAGVLGLILVGLAATVAVRSLLCKRTQEMEKEADEGEFLQTYWISSSKMPRAEVTRTQPVLECKSLPNPKISWYA